MAERQAILIVDHGSRRAASNLVLESVGALVREQAPDAIVEIAHMELAEPSIAAGLERCVRAGATHVVVVPYFLGPGRHAREDVPRLAAEAAARHPGVEVRTAEPLGPHRLLAELVVERAGLAAPRFALWRQDVDGKRSRIEVYDELEAAHTALTRFARVAPELRCWLERER